MNKGFQVNIQKNVVKTEILSGLYSETLEISIFLKKNRCYSTGISNLYIISARNQIKIFVMF